MDAVGRSENAEWRRSGDAKDIYIVRTLTDRDYFEQAQSLRPERSGVAVRSPWSKKSRKKCSMQGRRLGISSGGGGGGGGEEFGGR